MKIKFFSLFLLIVTSSTNAQNYQISFTGTGASTIVDSVKVENLTQCTSIYISGSDVLNLAESVGVMEMNSNINSKMHIYPNPTSGICLFGFEATAKGNATISLYDLSGK